MIGKRTNLTNSTPGSKRHPKAEFNRDAQRQLGKKICNFGQSQDWLIPTTIWSRVTDDTARKRLPSDKLFDDCLQIGKAHEAFKQQTTICSVDATNSYISRVIKKSDNRNNVIEQNWNRHQRKACVEDNFQPIREMTAHQKKHTVEFIRRNNKLKAKENRGKIKVTILRFSDSGKRVCSQRRWYCQLVN